MSAPFLLEQSEVKHTPAPWVVIPRGESSGHSVGTIEPKPPTMEGPNYWTVASVNVLRAGWQANLHLIAAAPELLEALQAFNLKEEWIVAGTADSLVLRVPFAVIQKAAAAIRKATLGSAS